MTTRFKNYGIPEGFSTVSRTANQAPLFSQVPEFGGNVTIEIEDPGGAAPVPQYALVGADGQLVTYTAAAGGDPESIDDAVGVAVSAITAEDLERADDASEPIYVLAATSGHFLLEGLVLHSSITALTVPNQLRVVRMAMAAAGDNMKVNSNRYAGV